MPSLSIDRPHHTSPSPTHHHHRSPNNRHHRRPHYLRIQSPPRSPLIFGHSYHHHSSHSSADRHQQLLTPEIISSYQSSPWKGTLPSSSIKEHQQPSMKVSSDNFNFSHSNSISSIHGPSNGSTLTLSHSQQNFLQRQFSQRQAAAQSQQSSSKSSVFLSPPQILLQHSHQRNDDIFTSTINDSSQFYPSEISLMRMDEYSIPFNAEIDFTQPDPSRPLQIRVSGRSIYVDPQFAQDLSPIFTNFLARELAAGKRKCVEMQREDISFSEVLEMAKVLCPYELGMFPKPVEASTFCSLSRLSRKFKVQKLKLACELFVSRMSLEDPSISNETLLGFIVSSYLDGLSTATRLRLLEAIVSRGVTNIDRQALEIPGLPELIREAVSKYHAHELSHGELTNDVRLRVPCRSCRIEQPNVPLPAIKGELSSNGIPAFVICLRCKSTICCGCVLKPCKKALEEFVKKFTERFNPY